MNKATHITLSGAPEGFDARALAREAVPHVDEKRDMDGTQNPGDPAAQAVG